MEFNELGVNSCSSLLIENVILEDFLLSIGFSRTPSVLAEKTEQKCSLWFAEVSVVLKKFGEYDKKAED